MWFELGVTCGIEPGARGTTIKERGATWSHSYNVLIISTTWGHPLLAATLVGASAWAQSVDRT